MHIVVDGYNFIGRYHGLLGDIEGKREALINLLSKYRALRGHNITVVFDGWQNGMPNESSDFIGGVRVIFSKLGEKADDVIKRLSMAGNQDMLVITSDRDISAYVTGRGVVAIGCGEFERKLMEVSHLDRGSLDAGDKEVGIYTGGFITTKKKGNPRRLSKRDRKKRMRMDKM